MLRPAFTGVSFPKARSRTGQRNRSGSQCYFPHQVYERPSALPSSPRVNAEASRPRLEGGSCVLRQKAELKIYERRCQIERLLDAETSSDDVQRSKPYPDIFMAVRRKLAGITPDRCVVLGDSPYDAMAARKAGMHSIGFLCGGFGRKNLSQAGAEHLYRDASDLLRNFDHSIFAQE
jgi:beta-phosphoglucomutase-like phosphatase (HAD superfamily)